MAHLPDATRSRFYVGVGLFMVVLNLAGFLPSFIDPSRRVGPPTLGIMIHAVLAASWILLFLGQSFLVLRARTSVHRRVGLAGAVLAFAMIGSGVITVTKSAHRGFDLSGDIARVAVPPGAPPPTAADHAVGMFPPLLAFANFGVLTGLGLWFRHRPEVHKRLMVLGLSQLVSTPLIHLTGFLVGIWPSLHGALSPVWLAGFLLPFGLAVHDRVSSGRIHALSLWIPLLLILETFGLFALVMPTQAWRQAALWLVSAAR